MLRILLVMMFLFSGALGCKSIQSSDLTGTWVMKESSRQFLPVELRKASARIVLNTNGSFVASELPGLLYFAPPDRPRLDTGSGSWQFTSRNGIQHVHLDFDVLAEGKQNGVSYGTHLDVSRWWSTVSLFYYFDDPDEGRKVEFEKK